jgi:hypothetical protein
LSIGERDLDADEQAVAAAVLASKSLNEPVYEELTVAQIDVRTREEVWSAVPPGVVHVGLRGPGTAGVASGRPKGG